MARTRDTKTAQGANLIEFLHSIRSIHLASVSSMDNMETKRFYICFSAQRKRNAKHSKVTVNGGELT
tara:strand:- start:76560 stop:76760 length:201 start_codon:yes stop_codon:yes gene_type:complete